MTSNETGIRRLANGSIDTDYYIRHCHRQRSLAAHRAITRVLAAVKRVLAGNRRGVDGSSLVVEIPTEPVETRHAERTDRRAA